MNKEEARAIYQEWTRRKPDEEFDVDVKYPDRFIALGVVVEIVYWSDKWRQDGQMQGYYHKTTTAPLVYVPATKGKRERAVKASHLGIGSAMSSAMLGILDEVTLLAGKAQTTKRFKDALLLCLDENTVCGLVDDDKITCVITGISTPLNPSPRDPLGFKVTRHGLVG